MSGGFVAYNQRPNKAVERYLFVDLLIRLNRMFPIQHYTYIGFGGPFLEDFKLIHSYFDNKKMISIEGDGDVYKRQIFNMPYTCIDPLHTMSAAFVNDYLPSGNCIIWLDYAATNEYKVQLGELEVFLRKALVGDVVKITLNANPSSLSVGNPINNVTGQKFTEKEQIPKRIKAIEEQIDDYVPYEISDNDVKLPGFPLLLNKTIQHVASKALSQRLDNGKVVFQPLTCFTYADSNHQMMTLTGILINKVQVGDLLGPYCLSSWELATPKWGQMKAIAVPNLSHKEKTFIDRNMPKKSAKQLRRMLRFKLDKDDDLNLQYLESYIKYYRYFQSFHRVVF